MEATESQHKEESDQRTDTPKKQGCCGDCSTGLSCLCGPRSCHLCCGCLPPINQSTGTRLMYCLGLILFTAGAGLLNSDGFEEVMTRERDDGTSAMSQFCGIVGTFNGTAANDCAKLFSYSGVYLLYLCSTIFYVLMAIITINLKKSTQFRAKVHNGFWFWKLVFNIGLVVGLLMTIRVGSDTFVTYWKWIGLVFGSLFVIWQTVVLVRFAFTWSTSWYKASRTAEKEGRACVSRIWRFGLWTIGLFLVLGSGAMMALMVFVFTETPSGILGDNCQISYWFIISTSIGCLLVLLISLLPCNTRGYATRHATTGILQSGVIIGQITYSTFTTVNSQMPVQVNETCVERCFNVPEFLLPNDLNQQDVLEIINDINTPCSQAVSTEVTTIQTVANAIAIALSLFLTIYSAFNSSMVTAKEKKPTDDLPMFCCCLNFGIELPKFDKMDIKGQDVIEDDKEQLTYRYWAFHLIFASASMYLMMTMTNWYDPADSLEETFEKGDQAGFYIQAVTTLVILAVYLLTLVAPIFCPSTDFGSRLQSARRGQINNSVGQDPDITDFGSEKQAHHGPVAGEEL